MTSFPENLKLGKVGESVIARWLISRGHCVLPVYEKETKDDEFKGPQFFTPAGQFVAPDMFIMPGMYWVEAKHKTVFSWHRNSKPQRWTTGIDRHHYKEYLRVQELSEHPIWLMFLHRCSEPKAYDKEHGCPPKCPTGLFGAPLHYLAENINHENDNWGKYGMVYWATPPLHKLADITELEGMAA